MELKRGGVSAAPRAALSDWRSERIVAEAGHEDRIVGAAAAWPAGSPVRAAPDIAGDVFELPAPPDAAEVALVEFPPEAGAAFHDVTRIRGAGAAFDKAP